MNMKKTFAGALAGALAVSAMATSASASVPGPGEYTVDLTRDAEFYATVQFTFDGDYMLNEQIAEMKDGDACKYLTLGFSDSTGLFKLGGMKEMTVEVVGSTGVKTQVLKFNTTWNDADFYDWNLFDWAASDNEAMFKLLVADKGVANNAQTLYLDKYNTVKEALAVSTSTGDKKYPVGSKGENLDLPYFDKIVITAKVPCQDNVTALNMSLDGLNSKTASYKTGLKSYVGGVNPITIREESNEDAKIAQDNLNKALAAKTKFALADAAYGQFVDAFNTFLAAAGLDASKYTVADFNALAVSDAIPVKAASALEAAKLAQAAYNNAVAAIPAEYVAKYYDPTFDIDAEVKTLEDIVKAHQTLGITSVVVDVDNTTIITRSLGACHNWATINLPAAQGETKFTKYEKERVGVKSGVVIDGDGKVKTLSGDIGAWKPDALRQIADAIADNEGVTLTFTAKDEFNDTTYKNWMSAWMDYVYDRAGHDYKGYPYANYYYTDNVKDDYEVWGESMFTGAIVLNRDFSKQFSQSNLCDWGTKTVTFDWDELTEGRFYDASVVLHTMEILSTQNVEWVACTVTVPEQGADAEDVAPSQGAEDNSTEIDDTPVTDAPAEVITEAPVTEAPAPETTAAPVKPEGNPQTGNAPVALAVIPVALAAAAIVAKKRG